MGHRLCRADHLEVRLGRAGDLGARRVVGPTPIGEAGEIAVFTDPDGNMLGLVAGMRVELGGDGSTA